MDSFSFNNPFTPKNDTADKKPDNKQLMELIGQHYENICSILKDNNVPITRMPTIEHFMSRVFNCLDQDKLQDWLTKYIQLESFDLNTEEPE